MCNFSGMIKNVLPSLRQRAGPQRICSRQKSIRSGTARDSFSQTPHMRGKVSGAVRRGTAVGITPAYAGKSKPHPWWRRPEWDHPRVCGEKTVMVKGQERHLGSPPHVRGKVCHVTSCGDFPRITPAYAGKSFIVLSEGMIFRDHPRMCGEKSINLAQGVSSYGSPPHVRGKAGGQAERGGGLRITPACAGKSVDFSVAAVCFGDHPRVCGEK